MERWKSFCSLPQLRGPVRDCMDVSAALLQLEALTTRFFSSARPAAAALRAPLDNRKRHGAVLVPGAECTRRRDEIQKESSFSQGPSADGTECQERRQCDPKGANERKNCTRLDKRPFALTMDVRSLCLFRRI